MGLVFAYMCVYSWLFQLVERVQILSDSSRDLEVDALVCACVCVCVCVCVQVCVWICLCGCVWQTAAKGLMGLMGEAAARGCGG